MNKVSNFRATLIAGLLLILLGKFVLPGDFTPKTIGVLLLFVLVASLIMLYVPGKTSKKVSFCKLITITLALIIVYIVGFLIIFAVNYKQ